MRPPYGGHWTKKRLRAFFKDWVALVCTPERTAQLTVHSLRVYLACALLAAGATPEQIMQLLRWSSETARKLYARLSIATAAAAIDAAADVEIDSILSHTLRTVGAAETASSASAARAASANGAAEHGEAPHAVSDAAATWVARAATLTQAAHERDDESPTLEALREQLPELDEDGMHVRVHLALRAGIGDRARAFDTRLEAAEPSDSDASDD